MKRILLLVFVGLAGLSIGPDATAGHHYRQVHYVGVHPIPKAYGGGICHIEGPHVHVYMVPDARRDYRKHGDALYYVGDPVAHGWDGPRYAYYGPHPVRVDAVVGDDDPETVYCYIKGPHYHVYAPPEVVSADFQLRGGAYWYVGAPPPAMLDARPEIAEVNAYYEPLHYDRPVVEVDAAPPGWIGARLDLVGPSVEVHTPGVVVDTPHVVVETPPPPVVRAGVDVEAHVALPSLDVHVGGPAVILGAPPPDRVIIIDDHHRHPHDHGRHRGWFRPRGRDHRR